MDRADAAAPGAPASPASGAPATMTPAVWTQGLRLQRGRGSDLFSLDVPDLVVHPGEAVACVGPSGCGKTTLLHAITGILRPVAGRCVVAGHEVSSSDDAARRRFRLRTIGLVFQDFELLSYLSALDNIVLPVRLAGDPVAPARRAARSIAAELGIDRLLRRKPERLSQGERQRVAIARALVAGPTLLACDEPTASLDAARAAATVDLIIGRARAAGAAAFVVTHDPSVLGRFDRVLDLGAVLAAPATGTGGGFR